MVPFVKVSAEIYTQKAKALAADTEKMQYLSLPANDDKYSVTYYGAPETKISNE